MADYAAAAEHLRALATQLAGLVRAAPNQGLNRGLPIKQIEIPLLALGSKTSKIVVSDAEIARAAAPWRERERQLLADPMADVTLPGAN